MLHNETKPLGSATFFKAFFAGFKTYPTKESFPESKALKKRVFFEQTVVQINCKTEEYDYNQPAINKVTDNFNIFYEFHIAVALSLRGI